MTFDSQPGSVRPVRADCPRRRIVVLRLPTTAGLTRYAVRECLVPENYTGPFGGPPVPAAF
jgi:hypothetical protein